ncbi:Scr1 family TA system antitoxin-like transcriptional regulator [Streptomyces sp. URMC 129]|uniref:DUF397 domain-containing protein n=1 Tax=Streptomyces sp. URMC 129 TaxID=3423407 RepID=UPI003F1CC776
MRENDPRVTVQVLPCDSGTPPSTDSSPVLPEVRDGSESAYEEGCEFGQLDEDEAEVAQYPRAHEHIRAMALPPHLSLRMMRSVVEDRRGAEHESRPSPNGAAWPQSSYSNPGGGECVEVADGFPGLLPARDTKTPTGPVPLFPTTARTAFLNSRSASR